MFINIPVNRNTSILGGHFCKGGGGTTYKRVRVYQELGVPDLISPYSLQMVSGAALCSC